MNQSKLIIALAHLKRTFYVRVHELWKFKLANWQIGKLGIDYATLEHLKCTATYIL